MSNIIIGAMKLTIGDPEVCSVPPEVKGCETCEAPWASAYTGNPNDNLSSNPVRYGTGEPLLHADDLPGASGYGLKWGQIRSYSPQLTADYNLGVGMNWQVAQWAHLALRFDDTTYHQGALTSRVIRDANETLKYDQSMGGYTPQFQTKEPLKYSVPSYLHRQLDGGYTHHIGLTGMLKSHTDSRGNSITVTKWVKSGFQPKQVQRVCVTPAGTVTESYDYTFLDESDPSPLVTSVLLSRTTGTSVENVSQVNYTFTTDGQRNLQTATTQIWKNGGWVTRGTYYYRYGSGTHLIKFALDPGSFERLSADPGVTDPLTAPDSIVALYADYYFEWNGSRQVTREVVKSGSQTFLMAYAASGFTDDYNHWKTKTTETLPDDNTNIVYSNYAGQTMLKVLKSGSDKWCEFTKYDANGRAVLFANPSAVSGYDEAFADLLDFDSGAGKYLYLRDHAGLLRAVTYHDPSDSERFGHRGDAARLLRHVWQPDLGDGRTGIHQPDDVRPDHGSPDAAGAGCRHDALYRCPDRLDHSVRGRQEPGDRLRQRQPGPEYRSARSEIPRCGRFIECHRAHRRVDRILRRQPHHGVCWRIPDLCLDHGDGDAGQPGLDHEDGRQRPGE